MSRKCKPTPIKTPPPIAPGTLYASPAKKNPQQRSALQQPPTAPGNSEAPCQNPHHHPGNSEAPCRSSSPKRTKPRADSGFTQSRVGAGAVRSVCGPPERSKRSGSMPMSIASTAGPRNDRAAADQQLINGGGRVRRGHAHASLLQKKPHAHPQPCPQNESSRPQTGGSHPR